MYSETQKGAEQGLTRGGASGRECSQKLELMVQAWPPKKVGLQGAVDSFQVGVPNTVPVVWGAYHWGRGYLA